MKLAWFMSVLRRVWTLLVGYDTCLGCPTRDGCARVRMCIQGKKLQDLREADTPTEPPTK